jgi:hypothetical protein
VPPGITHRTWISRPATFWTYLVAALQGVAPEAGAAGMTFLLQHLRPRSTL